MRFFLWVLFLGGMLNTVLLGVWLGLGRPLPPVTPASRGLDWLVTLGVAMFAGYFLAAGW
jgi:hypothetical protein